LYQRDELRALEERFGVVETERLAQGWWRIRFTSDTDPEEVASAYGRVAGVAAAQPSFVYDEDAIPSDPRYSSQYAHRLTQAPSGWDVTTGNRSVVIAVIGDGIDLAHPDLVNNLWRNAAEVAGDGIDNDGNGFVDDIHGWDFIDNDGRPHITSEHHETAVAGVIAAEGDNGIGVAGVAWRASLMPIRVLKQSSHVASAIHYAIDNGASIINMSMSSPTGFRDAMMTDALARAEARQVIVVASAGNLNNDVPRYPAAFPTVLGVGATTADDRRASYSCYGAWVNLAAPGDGVLTTYPNNRYDTAGGTSYAAPYVAGTAALLRARDPSLSAAAARGILLSSGDAIASDRPIGRRVNVARALGAATPTSCSDPSWGARHARRRTSHTQSSR
jgi:subtilisin family serine protease